LPNDNFSEYLLSSKETARENGGREVYAKSLSKGGGKIWVGVINEGKGGGEIFY